MYAVLGSPIQHSLSPRIFNLFAKQLKQQLDYRALEVKPEELSVVLKALYEQGYQGVNLTTPLKEKVLPLVAALSEEGRVAGAVNVLRFQDDGCYYGHNSDGLGFIRDLTKIKKYSIQGKSVLILGAGGAVRGIMAALLQEKPQQLVIFNRTEAKARCLIEDFQDDSGVLSFSSWSQLSKKRFDLIIHCTTLGLYGERLPLSAQILNQEACCYDLSYGKAALPFLSWAQEQGVLRCYDGLGMLIEQAAEAFYLWRQLRVETEAVHQELKEATAST